MDTAGSRHIGTDVDLSPYDFAFPSSAPAAQTISEADSTTGRFTPFYSPMAVATFGTITDMLKTKGIVSNLGGTDAIDLGSSGISASPPGKNWVRPHRPNISPSP